MPLVQIILVLVVVGVLLWLINRYIPMQGTIKSILNAVEFPAPCPCWRLASFDETLSSVRLRAQLLRFQISPSADYVPLAIAQHSPRDFLTPDRASVSVKECGAPSHFATRDR